jgi:hypothetical protein
MPFEFYGYYQEDHMVIQCSKCKILTSTAECDVDYVNRLCGCGGKREFVSWNALRNRTVLKNICI